jgi:hypothetical protein
VSQSSYTAMGIARGARPTASEPATSCIHAWSFMHPCIHTVLHASITEIVPHACNLTVSDLKFRFADFFLCLY